MAWQISLESLLGLAYHSSHRGISFLWMIPYSVSLLTHYYYLHRFVSLYWFLSSSASAVVVIWALGMIGNWPILFWICSTFLTHCIYRLPAHIVFSVWFDGLYGVALFQHCTGTVSIIFCVSMSLFLNLYSFIGIVVHTFYPHTLVSSITSVFIPIN